MCSLPLLAYLSLLLELISLLLRFSPLHVVVQDRSDLLPPAIFLGCCVTVCKQSVIEMHRRAAVRCLVLPY